jgi:hypothetical protein
MVGPHNPADPALAPPANGCESGDFFGRTSGGIALCCEARKTCPNEQGGLLLVKLGRPGKAE